jgi:hypothetical protein
MITPSADIGKWKLASVMKLEFSEKNELNPFWFFGCWHPANDELVCIT